MNKLSFETVYVEYVTLCNYFTLHIYLIKQFFKCLIPRNLNKECIYL